VHWVKDDLKNVHANWLPAPADSFFMVMRMH